MGGYGRRSRRAAWGRDDNARATVPLWMAKQARCRRAAPPGTAGQATVRDRSTAHTASTLSRTRLGRPRYRRKSGDAAVRRATPVRRQTAARVLLNPPNGESWADVKLMIGDAGSRHPAGDGRPLGRSVRAALAFRAQVHVNARRPRLGDLADRLEPYLRSTGSG